MGVFCLLLKCFGSFLGCFGFVGFGVSFEKVCLTGLEVCCKFDMF